MEGVAMKMGGVYCIGSLYLLDGRGVTVIMDHIEMRHSSTTLCIQCINKYVYVWDIHTVQCIACGTCVLVSRMNHLCFPWLVLKFV